MTTPRDNGSWNVLLVDDEKSTLQVYGTLLRDDGHPVLLAETGAETRAILRREERVGLAILDLKLPDVEGLDLFRWVRRERPELPVIILTGHGTVESAVQALTEGAVHYLTKPPDLEQWRSLVRMALQGRLLEEENRELRSRLREREATGTIIGRSRAMEDVLQWIRTAGPSQSSVLVQGESGTGKELAARALHDISQRSGGPFVSINCGALPPGLLESELFGYEKGAFTGAGAARAGHFERADGGTLFLDEVGECSPELQVRLLRVLQEKEFLRIGGTRSRRSDFRLVAATNRDLAGEVAAGRFREDLFYRIHVITFTMPPLRERRDDVVPLATHFLERYAAREGKEVRGIAEGAVEALAAHDWPGNVRELENVIERGVVVADGPRLEREHLPSSLLQRALPPASVPAPAGDVTLSEMEAALIGAALERHGGNKSRASRSLGITRKLLYSKIREYGLETGPAAG